MKQLELKNITFKYDQVIFDQLNVKLDDGKIHVILGPSGSGKTTLLNLIAGLIQPTTGDIYFDGQSLLNKTPYQRDIGYAFQDSQLFPHMNVKDNIAFGFKELKNETFIQTITKTLKINHLLDSMPHQISIGEKQRVSLARSMISHPRILLMDEPFSSLDLMLKNELIEMLKTLQETYQMLVIYVTHDQQEAFALADQLIILNERSIQQIGDVHQIYNNPANRFVARFIGIVSTNIIEGNIENGVFNFEGHPLNLKHLENIKNQKGLIQLGIRPEHIIDGPYLGKVVDVRSLGYGQLIKIQYKNHLLYKMTSQLYQVDDECAFGFDVSKFILIAS